MYAVNEDRGKAVGVLCDYGANVSCSRVKPLTDLLQVGRMEMYSAFVVREHIEMLKMIVGGLKQSKLARRGMISTK